MQISPKNIVTFGVPAGLLFFLGACMPLHTHIEPVDPEVSYTATEEIEFWYDIEQVREEYEVIAVIDVSGGIDFSEYSIRSHLTPKLRELGAHAVYISLFDVPYEKEIKREVMEDEPPLKVRIPTRRDHLTAYAMRHSRDITGKSRKFEDVLMGPKRK